jgi:hypothetical protein
MLPNADHLSPFAVLVSFVLLYCATSTSWLISAVLSPMLLSYVSVTMFKVLVSARASSFVG